MNTNIEETLDNGSKCTVCDQVKDVRRLFGTDSCQACASFFRRTVLLKITYLCKNERSCRISYHFRIICRSCRYDKCIKNGMKIESVRIRKNLIKVPRYIQRYREATNCDTVIRGNQSSQFSNNQVNHLISCITEYATSSLSKFNLKKSSSVCSSLSHSSSLSPPLTEFTDLETDSPRYSSILDISSDDLLEFYVEQTKLSLNDRNDVNYDLGEMAFQMCRICPGVDLLEPEELEILYRYSFFVCEIMDSAWAELTTQDTDSNNNTHNKMNEIPGLEKTLKDVTDILKCLKLNDIEYSAFKAMCIWKLGMFDFTVSMKIIAQEHYSSIFSALKNYYENALKKPEMFAITRTSDITLILGNIFEVYCEMIIGFEKNNILLVSNLSHSECPLQEGSESI